MKILSFLFLTIFMARGCEKEPKMDINAIQIEYLAYTRGFYTKIKVEKKIAKIFNDRNEKPIEIKISDQDWETLGAIVKEIDIDEIENLKAPTEKRFYDGAAIAHIKVTYKEKIYESAAFDHGAPPLEIKELVTKINSFAIKNNDN